MGQIGDCFWQAWGQGALSREPRLQKRRGAHTWCDETPTIGAAAMPPFFAWQRGRAQPQTETRARARSKRAAPRTRQARERNRPTVRVERKRKTTRLVQNPAMRRLRHRGNKDAACPKGSLQSNDFAAQAHVLVRLLTSAPMFKNGAQPPQKCVNKSRTMQTMSVGFE